MKKHLSADARTSLATALCAGRRLFATVARTGCLLAAPVFAGNIAAAPRTYAVECDTAAPVLFGVERLTEALRQRGFVADVRGALKVRAKIAPSQDLGSESYRITAKDGQLLIAGGDAAGVMYGAFEAAEHIAAGIEPGQLNGVAGRPGMAIRAVKVNLPWMSYRVHDFYRRNETICRDLDFWKALIDHLAESRFNRLSLWSLHPYHLMVRSKEFPESCDLSDAELAQWQMLWRGIFRHAHDRGMKVQLFTWNIFVSPAFAKAHNVATYSMNGDFFGDGDRSEIVERYNRSILTQVLKEYPELDGIGITQSERMGGMTPAERGEWIDRVILSAIRDAGRPVEVNYRAPHSKDTKSGGSMSRDTELLGRRLLESVHTDAPVYTELKYNWSHGHSSPKLHIIHGGAISDALWNPLPKDYRITWMVRNEDFFLLRWCGPSFVREHIRLNSQPWTGGYYVGSECYIPAANFFDKPDLPGRARWAFQRQRLFYVVWGRQLYDPNLDDAALARSIDRQYGQGTGATLLPVLDMASRTPLRIATFMGATSDPTLYSEGFLSKKGFLDIKQVIQAKPLDPQWLGVSAMIDLEARKGGPKPNDITPLAVAEAAERDARETLARLASVGTMNAPVSDELADAATWAHLGLYLGDKIRAAVALERYRRGLNDQGRDEAIALLQKCLQHWDQVVASTRDRYSETPLLHTDAIPFFWARYRAAVAADISIAQKTKRTR